MQESIQHGDHKDPDDGFVVYMCSLQQDTEAVDLRMLNAHLFMFRQAEAGHWVCKLVSGFTLYLAAAASKLSHQHHGWTSTPDVSFISACTRKQADRVQSAGLTAHQSLGFTK